VGRSLQIWSGGQTGVDEAALRAAKRLSISTCGWAPRGWLTEAGPRPDFAETYGMIECDEPEDPSAYSDRRKFESDAYRERTRRNVRDSHITLWYGALVPRGYIATMNAARQFNKNVVCADYYGVEETIYEIKRVAISWPLYVNCAGNRESSNEGVGVKAEAFWLELFTELKKELGC
jgi:Circularly permutated YpsA SLOG family